MDRLYGTIINSRVQSEERGEWWQNHSLKGRNGNRTGETIGLDFTG